MSFSAGGDKNHAFSVPAIADVLGARFVKFDGSYAVDDADVVGVTDAPALVGETLSIITYFSAAVVAAATIAKGDQVGVSNDGTGRAVPGGSVGIAATGGVAGTRIEVALVRRPGVGGGGGGGGAIGGGGDSITAATNVAGKLATLKQNGVLQTYTWVGNAPTQRAAFGGLVTEEYTENGHGFWVADPSSNILVHGGAMRMDWATAVAIGEAIVAGTYVAGVDFDPGFRVYITDLAGGTHLEWSTLINWWRGLGGAPILLASAVAESTWHTGVTTESAARFSVTIPGKLAAINGGQIIGWASLENDNGAGAVTVGTMTPRWKLGATQQEANASGAGRRKATAACLFTLDGARNSQTMLVGGFPYNSAGASPVGAGTENTAADIALSLTYQLATAADRVRYRAARAWIQN